MQQFILLKQDPLNRYSEAAKAWFKTLTQFFKKIGLNPANEDDCLFVGRDQYVLLHSDDMLLIGHRTKIDQLKSIISQNFDITQHEFKKCLGIIYQRFQNRITMSGTHLIEKAVNKYCILTGFKVSTPLPYIKYQ
jgi:arginine deiminase